MSVNQASLRPLVVCLNDVRTAKSGAASPCPRPTSWRPALRITRLGHDVADVAAQGLSAPSPDAVRRGEMLFAGQTRFAHDGPACIACHSVGGLSFPNGGTLGPDLTHVAARMGEQGLQSALETLYFPAMVPLYKTKPLTTQERQDLSALFRQADSATPPAETMAVAGLAFLVFVVFVLITWWKGRGRLRGVRRRLVETARSAASQRASVSPHPVIEGDPQ